MLTAHTSAAWPGKRVTASQVPSVSPAAAPSRQAVPLTRSDRPTMPSSAGSARRISVEARFRLSTTVLIGDCGGGPADPRHAGILATPWRAGDMKPSA
ncbi:MAG: hypothetical protein AMXMBFR66_30110 [Pseudomonadota bacterium]